MKPTSLHHKWRWADLGAVADDALLELLDEDNPLIIDFLLGVVFVKADKIFSSAIFTSSFPVFGAVFFLAFGFVVAFITDVYICYPLVN